MFTSLRRWQLEVNALMKDGIHPVCLSVCWLSSDGNTGGRQLVGGIASPELTEHHQLRKEDRPPLSCRAVDQPKHSSLDH